MQGIFFTYQQYFFTYFEWKLIGFREKKSSD